MASIIIAGGTGHLGSSLATRLVEEGNKVTVLTRTQNERLKNINYVLWDARTTGSWVEYIDSADVVINLCGKSVDCRYTEANKLELIRSRVATTVLIGEAISRSSKPPSLWINASSSAYYGFSSRKMDERAGPGDDFPARICVEWERAFLSASTTKTRKVAWRLGVVLQRNKGLVMPFAGLVKSFLGGKLGSGKQFFTWIHEEDFLNSALWTINNEHAAGAYNLTSPEPVSNEDFMKALRKAIGVDFHFSLPEWLIKIGGKIVGTEPYLILDGRRIIPARLVDAGFKFHYSHIEPALNDLFKKRKHDGI